MIKWDAEQIRKFRLAHRLTRKQLGSILGVTDRTIYYWERDLRTPSKSLEILLSKLENSLTRKGVKKMKHSGMVIDYGQNHKARVMSMIDYNELPESERPDILTVWETWEDEKGCHGEKKLCDANLIGAYCVVELISKN